MNKSQFFDKSWCRFKYDETLMQWISRALPCARETVAAEKNAQWLRCGGTWFAGVNLLPNSTDGSVCGGSSMRGEASDFIAETLGLDGFDWDRAQVSVCYPGYPRSMPGESEAAFGYRRDRDAAHVDGFLAEGSERRRHLREHHGFILGIPMVEFSPGASPFVVWEGSHEVIRKTFTGVFRGVPAEQWGEMDITGVYHQVRRRIFDRCKRVEIYARPGEAYLVHRLALHGVAPWQSTASATADGRMICYFRPATGDPEAWLVNP
ncbi:MAG: hypothetical protein ACE1ZB_07165 [Gammaproteobacteria bacterium]